MKRFTKKQIQYLRLSVGMTGTVYLNDAAAETILQVQAEMERLGGDYSLRDAAKIASHIEKKYKV
jgi:uncharacterized protein YxjI